MSSSQAAVLPAQAADAGVQAVVEARLECPKDSAAQAAKAAGQAGQGGQAADAAGQAGQGGQAADAAGQAGQTAQQTLEAIQAAMQQVVWLQTEQNRLLADTEKASHFVERRSDSAAGLKTDWDRHSQQYREALAAIDSEPGLSQAEKTAQKKELRECRKGEWADRLVSLLKGSCVAPFLLCL